MYKKVLNYTHLPFQGLAFSMNNLNLWTALTCTWWNGND